MTAGQRRINGRAGCLKAFNNMPLDILFEVARQLKPLDLLHLSRVSKQLRAIFLSSKSGPVWAAARNNVNKLPDCSKELSEPEWAHLLFENICMDCGQGRAMKIEYAFRTRFCAGCRWENVNTIRNLGFHRYGSNEDIPKVAHSLLPREIGEFGVEDLRDRPGNRYENLQFDMVDVQEFESVMRKFDRLVDYGDERALGTFVMARQAHTKAVMKHAIECWKWHKFAAVEKDTEKNRISEQREADFVKRLKERGWSGDDFPTCYDEGSWHIQEWHKIMFDSKPLTNRIFKLRLPRVEAILKDVRAEKAETAARERTDED